MARLLKVLIAEDSERDALLVLHELKRAGFDCESRRVQSESDLRRELQEFRPHIVLSDFSMPAFNGIAALEVCRELNPDIPFIFVSGTIGENDAVEAMRAGANDYVMKNNLTRLGPAVRRELREVEGRRARRVAEAALRRAQVMAKLAHVITGPDGSIASWSETLPELVKVKPGQMPTSIRDWVEFVHPDDRLRFREAICAAVERKHVEVEYRLRRADEAYVHVWHDAELLQETPIAGGSGGWFHTLQDVTEREASASKIRRLNRVHAVLSGINSLIVRVRDRNELCRGACRIAFAEGRFPLAWIGLLDDPGLGLKLAAWEGNGEGFIERLPVLLSGDFKKGRGLARRAVAEAKAMIANDIASDERIAMREEALARGFRSFVALPLAGSEGVMGLVCLFAEQTGFFDEEEMRLLLELAGNISFAFEHIGKSQRLAYLAYHDELTGLANRALFDERLGQMLADAKRDQRRVALVVKDIERFKTINDTYGRSAGDALLKEVAQRMQDSAASWIARLGVDQFVAAIPAVESEEALVREHSSRMNDIFGRPFRIAGADLRVSSKAGIAVFPADGADAETLFRNAEAALKKAKTTGDKYLFYAREMTERVAGNLALENKLRQAIEREEFVLHYQPKVDLRTRDMVGVEALIRWQSPEQGLVAPGRFIPVLEQTGLILEVGSWALKRAARDHRDWIDQGLPAPRIAVNVSAIQLRQHDFVRVVEEAIGHGVAPTCIDLEITESLVMQDVKGTGEKLEAIRALGMSIAIDDFGTGYSSLGYLARLPVQLLKIDRSFVVSMESDPNAMTLVSTIISLAHAMRLKVIAEGVETEEQAKLLHLLRCDEMQGYLFSKPLPPDGMVALLRKGR